VVNVSIGTRLARYGAGKTKIKLTCTGPTGGTCRGSLTLTARMQVRAVRLVHGKRRELHVDKTIVLGHTSYSLGAGRSALLSVRLGKVPGTIRALAMATMQGSKTATRKITLVPAQKPRPRHRR
jgi:hypothetical protein